MATAWVARDVEAGESQEEEVSMVAPLLVAGAIGAGAALAGGIGKALSGNDRRPRYVPYGDDAFRTALQQQALGSGPSVAAQQAQVQSDEARQAAMSLAASGQGATQGQARYSAMYGNAAAQADIAQQGAMARVAEQNAAQGMYANYLGSNYAAEAEQQQIAQEEAWRRAAQRRANIQSMFSGFQGAGAAAMAGGGGGGA